MEANQMFTLKSRAIGLPEDSNFELRKAPVPELGKGEVLVRTAYLSVDPYMRRMMNNPNYELGSIFGGEAVGTVISSRHDGFREGDAVFGYWGWQTLAVFPGDKLLKLELEDLPIEAALGAVGMPGLTAYIGLLEIGQPKQGETVVVSGAAGAVGSIVGQIAKMKGAHVIGITGSDEKVAYVTEELGFDAAINYRTTPNLGDALSKVAQNGVDVYFDNVGGPIADAVIQLLNRKARVPICGQISQYNLTAPENGLRVGPILLNKSALMQGFMVDHYKERFPEGRKQLTEWVRLGYIRHREHIVEGLANTPQAFISLFHGENIGKLVVKVGDE